MHLREATIDDLAAVAVVCDASGRARWTAAAFAPREDRVAYVAIVDDGVVGAAKTHFHEDPDGAAPAGHYLGGIVVSPEFRRRGVGSRLTRARLEWIWTRADRAYYFTDEDNLASIRMHETLGFTRVAALPEIRGVTADHEDGTLILFASSRDPAS